jgi:hypothetical protein
VADSRLDKIRKLVRCGSYELSDHVVDAIEANEFTVDDIEDSILSGRIVCRQKDEVNTAIDGYKYKIIGRTQSGMPLETIGKIQEGFDDNEYFLITAY